jgi:uncharacterized membrane protein SirB2
MSVYQTALYLHIACAAISIIGFIIRGLLKMQGSALLQKKFVRIAPHIVDTVLLVSAIFLAVQRHEYPFVSGWLTAKTLGLFVYIGLGVVALRAGKTPAVRGVAFVLAILTFAYIVAVAVSKSALPFG